MQSVNFVAKIVLKGEKQNMQNMYNFSLCKLLPPPIPRSNHPYTTDGYLIIWKRDTNKDKQCFARGNPANFDVLVYCLGICSRRSHTKQRSSSYLPAIFYEKNCRFQHQRHKQQTSAAVQILIQLNKKTIDRNFAIHN